MEEREETAVDFAGAVFDIFINRFLKNLQADGGAISFESVKSVADQTRTELVTSFGEFAESQQN